MLSRMKRALRYGEICLGSAHGVPSRRRARGKARKKTMVALPRRESRSLGSGKG